MDVAESGQGAHVALEDAPVAVEEVSAGHKSHELALNVDEYAPGAHAGHTAGPVALAGYALPGGHVYGAHTGAVLPAAPAVPMGHSYATHAAALIAFATADHVPAGQSVQSIAEMAPGA